MWGMWKYNEPACGKCESKDKDTPLMEEEPSFSYLVLNMFGIVTAACMVYNMEFRGNAVKQMHMLPISDSGMYLCKFLILSAMFLLAAALQNLALMRIGMAGLPQGAFGIAFLCSVKS